MPKTRQGVLPVPCKSARATGKPCGLVKEPGEYKWSNFRHYALREIGVVEIE